MLVSRHLPRLFPPTASAFIIALKHQPHLFFANYLAGSRKPHPQNAIIMNNDRAHPHKNIKTGGQGN